MTKALVIVDMQRVMQQRIDEGRDCVNHDAAIRIRRLADLFRQRDMAVIHIRHRDDDPSSPMHSEADGHQSMPDTKAEAGEAVFLKRGSSGFASTGLEAHLRMNGIDDVIVVGAVAGFCVNSTVRAGADLGFTMTVVRDAVIGFDLPEAQLGARTIFDVTMAQLKADFATVVDTVSIIDALGTA